VRTVFALKKKNKAVIMRRRIKRKKRKSEKAYIALNIVK